MGAQLDEAFNIVCICPEDGLLKKKRIKTFTWALGQNKLKICK